MKKRDVVTADTEWKVGKDAWSSETHEAGNWLIALCDDDLSKYDLWEFNREIGREGYGRWDSLAEAKAAAIEMDAC